MFIKSVLAAAAAAPDWPDGMNDIFARQFICAGDLGITGVTPMQGPALFQQFPSCRPMNGSVHPAASEQRCVGSIDDSVHVCDLRQISDLRFNTRCVVFAHK
jgi:hypothetical protein